ncbi:MAG: HipA domain-containing protein [Corynebacterium sp.]|nr:HipA domain-containing protein [Corynebacterium sp.]
MDYTRLRFIDKADVYKGNALAGHLRRTETGSVVFRYLPEYSGQAVASTLPVQENEFFTDSGALPPFFSGLLPEGHRLSVIRNVTKTSLDDELTLLLVIGGDTLGDVRVVPHGSTPREVSPAVDLGATRLDFGQIANVVDGIGLPGVQTKASASMVNRPVSLSGMPSILKIDPPEHPHLVINESLHLTHAAELGIPISEHSVIVDSYNRTGLLVRRFDRKVNALGEMQRLALEDGAQVLGLWPAKKYSVDSEIVVNALSAKTSAPMIAKRNLYLQFIFAWLTGNSDLHAKNVSIVQDDSGKWQVTPVYDIPCTAVYGDMTMALPISGRTKNLRVRHWDEFANSIGLPLRAAHTANERALVVAQKIDLATLPFKGSPLTGAERELRRRRAEFR